MSKKERTLDRLSDRAFSLDFLLLSRMALSPPTQCDRMFPHSFRVQVDRAITFRVIRRCHLYLNSQHVSTGLMAGSHAAGQPTFSEGGQVYRENFGFWVAEILEALALLTQKRALLSLPACSTLI
jgi:hypothetical protein